MEKNVQSIERINMTKRNIIFIVIIIVLLVLTLFITLNNNHSNAIKKLTTKEVNEIVEDDDLIIIDVRTKEEYDSGHIPNAINIPYDEIEKVNYDKSKTIAVYCQTGKRSSNAALQLEKMGYNKIYDFGGISNYQGKLTTN